MRALLLFTLLLLPLPAASQVPSFRGLGDLPGGAVASAARGVSADGTTVVGDSESAAGTEAFRWTLAGGIVGLGFLPGPSPHSVARAASSDGSVIAGSSRDGSGVLRAFRWSAGTLTALDTLSCSDCDPVTEGHGVSANGLVVVGSALARGGGSAPLHLDPVRWAGGGTGLSDLGDLPAAEDAGEAYGASATGAVITGSHTTNAGDAAFSWTGSGLVALPELTGLSPRTGAGFAVSADGSTIVGYASKATLTLPGGTVTPKDLQAVRWTGPGFATVLELGTLPGSSVVDSRALAVSGNGSLIVGRAADASGKGRAFVWDAVHGMRDLKAVLVSDYGLDLEGWVLAEALGVSDPVADATTIVGRGTNPSGDPEGWVAVLVTPACSDGDDNDGDGDVDHPADGGCIAPVDWSEQPDCADGIDNDGDGLVDDGADDGCRSPLDPTEQPDCADGIDNDGDGPIDFPADPGCATADAAREDPACSDGADNDADLATDFPADLECAGPWDQSELAACSDGLDNDGDGDVDHPADPECDAPGDLSESPECSDGVDNDGDGRTDYPAQYPGCTDADDAIEAAQCSDGVDNDGDGDVDHPADGGCSAPSGASESPVSLAEDDLIAVDRSSRSVFRVDRTSGLQTLISQGALLTAPQGIVRRGPELLVADPAGLVAIDADGAQRLASPPLLGHESLQVVLDDSGDPLVLEAGGISSIDYVPAGLGAVTTWLAVPTGEVLPNLAVLDGDTLAREASGDLLTTGLGFVGSGVFRVDATPSAAILKPGVFPNLRWLDLAVEADGTVLAAGHEFDLGDGVYRIDPVSGDHTVLDNSHSWETPTGIAVDSQGDIWVADSGTCADGSCSGGEILRVDPVSGAVTPLTSGGFIAGELDLIVLPEPGAVLQLLVGLTALAGLRRVRARSG